MPSGPFPSMETNALLKQEFGKEAFWPLLSFRWLLNNYVACVGPSSPLMGED